MVTELPTIAARVWNSQVSKIRRARAVTGLGVRLWYTAKGIIVSLAGGREEFRHPWQMRGEWQPSAADPERLEFRVFVRPGFVTGRDVVIDMQGRESRRLDSKSGQAIERQHVRLTDPEPPFLVVGTWRNPIAAAGITATLEGELVALPGEGYPEFFARRGVRPASPGGNATEPGTIEAPFDAQRTRELRAADVVLVTPRTATATQVQPLDPLSQSATIELSSVFLNDAVRGQPRHRLVCVPKFVPPREPSAVERLLGTYTEPQTDELRIGTVWMVSPPDAGADAVPDDTWQAYFQNVVFWNLNHATRNEVPDAPQPPTRLQTGIPWADFFGNLQLQQSNDILAQVGAYLAGGDFSGIYWT
jgi:hypothetical protein